MAIDPVCKMEVEEAKAAATSEYKGKKYYFCAVGCIPSTRERNTTSALLAAEKLSTRTLRNTLLRGRTKFTRRR